MTTFTTRAQIEQAPTSELIAFYNKHSTKPVKKFSDRQTAIKRCCDLMDECGLSTDVLDEVAESNDGLSAEKIAEVKAGIEESHKEAEAEEAEAEVKDEKKAKWPFPARGATPAAPAGEEEKPAPKKSNVGYASNSAGVAASWANPAVHDARLTRDGVTVTVNGKKTEHKSTREAFRHYRLLDSKHIRFRGKLKAERKATYSENGVDYVFEIAQISA